MISVIPNDRLLGQPDIEGDTLDDLDPDGYSVVSMSIKIKDRERVLLLAKVKDSDAPATRMVEMPIDWYSTSVVYMQNEDFDDDRS